MRVLVVTMLHPAPDAPHQAGFMPGRLAALGRLVELTVVVPRRTLRPAAGRLRPAAPPPPGYRLFWGDFRALPGVGRNRRPAAIVRDLTRPLAALHESTPFDVVLGHFLFPDAVAAVELARRLDRPAVVVAHGSDVHQHAAVPARRRQIAAALEQAAGLIAVSAELRQRLLDLGLPAEGAEILPCGYDPERFVPRERAAARRELRLADARWLVFVGRLQAVKRIDLLLAALVQLPGVRLALVGDGPEAARLADRARRLGVAERVLWVGPQPHERVPLWLAAADAVVLASDREGTPTVLTEALALGAPVVATAVGGIPALVGEVSPLVPPGDAAALARAVAGVLAEPPAPEALRARVAHLTLPAIAEAEVRLLRSVVS